MESPNNRDNRVSEEMGEVQKSAPDWKKRTGLPCWCRRFLGGKLAESNFLNLATTAAKRPSAVTSQICDAFFYAGMNHKLAGDKTGAVELLQKCLDTKSDNDMTYMNASVELRL